MIIIKDTLANKSRCDRVILVFFQCENTLEYCTAAASSGQGAAREERQPLELGHNAIYSSSLIEWEVLILLVSTDSIRP
jgi:hypothetical protein